MPHRHPPRIRVVLALLGVLSGGGGVVGASAQPSSGGGLFAGIDPPPQFAAPAPSPRTLRQRFVQIDVDRLEAARESAADASVEAPALRLNLFDDARFTGFVERTAPTSAGYMLSGRLERMAGTMTWVVHDDLVSGTVRAQGAIYEIRSVGAGVHIIRQVDPAAFPPLRNDAVRPPPAPRPGPVRVRPIRPPERAPSTSSEPVAARPPAEDGSRIDVLVVYTRRVADEERRTPRRQGTDRSDSRRDQSGIRGQRDHPAPCTWSAQQK